MVCGGKVDLETAQHEIATDWIKAYERGAEWLPSVVSSYPQLGR
jgi:hypothetical protein